MRNCENLLALLKQKLGDQIADSCSANDEVTIEVSTANLTDCCLNLRDDVNLAFDQLIDVCGVDYKDYGAAEWLTDAAVNQGFDRGVEQHHHYQVHAWHKPRFAVVYHLLSITHNYRVRVRCFVTEPQMMIDSVTAIWSSANWFEREAFDLYGIIFVGHPDLRRILTDYGFIGHPFRKDFPLSGQVEVRYDANAKRVIYEPVDIEPRVLVPKVIRDDNRYQLDEEKIEKMEKEAGHV